MSWQVACKPSDVPAGEAIVVELEDNFIAIYNVQGEYFATDDTCSHEEASLVDGFLEGELIECPLHGSQFNVKTGEVLSPPAVMPIRTYPTMLEGDAVLVDLADASI
jgi:nitrite reductase/ring-hydroxylating ferredoxin subunit